MIGDTARSLLLTQKDDVNPIVAGGDLDDLPALMRGNIPAITSATYYEQPARVKPPRMCEMPENYFDDLNMGRD